MIGGDKSLAKIVLNLAKLSKPARTGTGHISLKPFYAARKGLGFMKEADIFTAIDTAIEMTRSWEYLNDQIYADPEISNFELGRLFAGELVAVPLNVGREMFVSFDNLGSLIMAGVTGQSVQEIQGKYGLSNATVFGHPVTERVTGDHIQKAADAYYNAF